METSNRSDVSTACTFAHLLDRALAEPNLLSRAYTAYYGYSIGTRLLALSQCAERGIEPGPLATFIGWKEKGGLIRKGEKAIVLCLSVTCKRQPTDEERATERSTQKTFKAADTILRAGRDVLGDSIQMAA